MPVLPYLILSTSPENIASVIILLFINISVFFILELVIDAYRLMHRQDIMRMESNYYKNQLEIMRESSERAAKIRHDFKNNLIALKMLVGEKNRRAADYIAALLESSDTLERMVSSGNIVVDSLLNYKLGPPFRYRYGNGYLCSRQFVCEGCRYLHNTRQSAGQCGGST